MSDNKNIDTVLEALKRSDATAFEKIYTDYYDTLCAYLLSYTNNKGKVEDIVQDTFVLLWRKRKEINITTSLKSYLFKIVYNKLIDTYRTDVKKDKMTSSYYYTEKTHAVNLIDDYTDEHLTKLDTCICVLPPRCKSVFIANKISGKKYKEVALEMDISIKTVENHVARAYKILRNCMINTTG